jgi:uncharacterized heparinase superfamily protein
VLGLYLRTARHYKPGQIAARLRLSVDSLLNRRIPGITRVRYRTPEKLAGNNSAEFFSKARPKFHLNLDEATVNSGRLQSGTFELLNKEVPLGTPVNWNPTGTTRLWRYNLHYFDYALDLALLADRENDQASADALGRLLRDWIEHNPIGQGVGWHSYPIARRIVNWIQAVTLATLRKVFPDSKSEAQFNRSLYQQARFLEDHLEFDCLGNHLLANGKALLFAGLFFGGAAGNRWHDKGQRILWSGLREQILDDGGHEERSPMYHTIVLQDYLEVVLAEQLNKRKIPGWVRERLIQMADYLDGILHPDGQIPLFGDSAFGIAHCPEDVLAASERLLGTTGRWSNVKPANYAALLAFPENTNSSQADLQRISSNCWPATGYAKIQGEQPGNQLIVDTKPLGPAHLPAHGHCSLFSYELSLEGKRIIVDSGVEEYETGHWRDFWRSTRAHNTLTVDGAEQSEMWASFRAGHRAALQQCAFAENDRGAIFVGRHGGFATQKFPTPHRRVIAHLNEGIWLVFDQVFGHGSHRIDSYVHFHPLAWCRISGDRVEFGRDETRAYVYPMKNAPAHQVAISLAKGSTNPIQGWYAPEFGKREPNHVICMSVEAKLPWQSGYLIVPDGVDVSAWNVELEERRSKAVTVAILIETKAGRIEKQFRIPQA